MCRVLSRIRCDLGQFDPALRTGTGEGPPESPALGHGQSDGKETLARPALERDPGLLEYALGRKVHIATPTTLVTMLRTAQYAWQQAALAENARAVFDLGRQLYDRISGLGGHVDRLGRTLAKAVTAYNQTVGSLESRVLPSARRLSELGVVDGEREGPALVEELPRALSAPELVAGPGPAETGPEETGPAEAGPGDAGQPDAGLDAASLVRTAR